MGASKTPMVWRGRVDFASDRAGLIVDVRHNRGGNIDSCILEKLLRNAWFHQGQIRDHPAPVPPPAYPDKASKRDRPFTEHAPGVGGSR